MQGNTLYFCDHQYGSGKTSAWLAHAASRAKLRNQCLIYPTLKLLNQKLEQFRQFASGDIDVRAVTSQQSARVIDDVVAAFNSAGNAQRRVLFITHQAWLELPHIHHADAWELCFDDCATTPFVDMQLDLPDQHHLLTDLLEPIDTAAEFSLLRVRDGQGGRLEQIAANDEGDAVLAVVARVARAMVRPASWHGVWCHVGNWRKVGAGAAMATTDTDRAERRSLFLQAEVNPLRYTSTAATTFLRTRWTGTLMHLNFTRNHGITFARHPSLKPAGQPYRGTGLRILHYQQEIFSKHKRDQPVQGGPTRFEQFQRHMEAIHRGSSYGVVMNEDKRRAGVTFAGARPIPPECAGQEDFADLTSIAAPIALRHSTRMLGLLHHRGITSEEANDDLYAEGIAQIIMRSAARRQGFNGEVTAHVMDAWVAARLLERFPQATAEHVPGIVSPVTREKRPDARRPGRKKLHDNGADRVRACRERKRAARIATPTTAAAG